MKKLISLLLVFLSLTACKHQQKADLIVVNANVYTVDDEFSKAEAFAIKDGKFIAIGTNDEIKQNIMGSRHHAGGGICCAATAGIRRR